jgi:hypothetical protein
MSKTWHADRLSCRRFPQSLQAYCKTVPYIMAHSFPSTSSSIFYFSSTVPDVALRSLALMLSIWESLVHITETIPVITSHFVDFLTPYRIIPRRHLKLDQLQFLSLNLLKPRGNFTHHQV